MSAAARLQERQAELLAAIERGRVPGWARADASEVLKAAMEAAAGRREAMTRRNAARWAASHERVRQALGPTWLGHPLAVLERVVWTRMKGTMSRRQIGEHLKVLQKVSSPEL